MRVRVFVALTLVVLTFAARPSSQNANPAVTAVSGQILVQFAPGANANDKANAHQQGGGTRLTGIARTGVELVSVRAGDESASIARYRRNPNVLYAEPNSILSIPEPLSHPPGSEVVPSDFWFHEQWGLHNTGQLFQCFETGLPPPFPPVLCNYIGTPDADIDAPEAWAMSTGSPVKVAVIDTGIDYNHPDLAPHYVGGKDYVHTVDGLPTNDPMDDHGHGTHVSGTIAASINNLTGDPAKEEGVVGVAPNALILAYKVCDANGSCTNFAIQQAIDQAITDGAKVINMSLGDPNPSQLLDDAVQRAWNAGLVIVAGAGNAGGDADPNNDTAHFYPAAFNNVISVAAFDEDHKRATFSTYGNDWVDISAPGNVIMSTYPLVACGGLGTNPGDMGCYTWNSGTSMASPHVAGAAALLWSRGDMHTNSEVVEALLQSANPQGVDAVPLNSWTIHGGLNLHDAMSYGLTNLPPVSNAGPDQNVVDEGDGAELITLDGSASTDSDGFIVSYDWREGGTSVGVGVNPIVPLSVGPHTLTLLVTDDDGATDTDDVVVTIQPAAATDTVVITRAVYNSRRGQLTIEATSSEAPSAALTAYDSSGPSNVEVGPLFYVAKKARYSATFNWPSKPTSITVVSSEGGMATSGVGGK
jgi:thermitase